VSQTVIDAVSNSTNTSSEHTAHYYSSMCTLLKIKRQLLKYSPNDNRQETLPQHYRTLTCVLLRKKVQIIYTFY